MDFGICLHHKLEQVGILQYICSSKKILRFKLQKQKIINYLLAGSIILLIGNILLDKFYKPNHSVIGVSINSFDAKFEKILSGYNLNDRWIIKKPVKTKLSDSLTKVYSVTLPGDLPLPVILSEVNAEYSNLPIRIETKEKNIGKKSLLRIYYKELIMLQADFNIDKNLSRKSNYIGFVLTGYSRLNKSEQQELLNLPEQYALTITPSAETELSKNEILNAGKEYVIVINNEMDEAKYRLKEDYTLSRNQLSVKNIISSFPEAKLFIVDSKSDYFRSPLFRLLKKEFEKRNLQLVLLSRFKMLDADDDQISKLLHKIVDDSSSVQKIIVANADNYLSLISEIERCRKKGNKFVFPSVLNFNL